MPTPSNCILSIQSSLVHGSAGNNVAKPLIQAMGLEIDCVSTVMLTLHAGYPAEFSKGYKYTPGDNYISKNVSK